jgi:hypothetical protein
MENLLFMTESLFEVVSVGITKNCADADRCHFERNQAYAIQIGFKPGKL